MDINEKKLKKRLIEKRKNIRNKLKLLKSNERVKEEVFAPITTHLTNIQSELKNVRQRVEVKKEEPIKQENKNVSLFEEYYTDDEKDTKYSTPLQKEKRISDVKKSIVSSIQDGDTYTSSSTPTLKHKRIQNLSDIKKNLIKNIDEEDDDNENEKSRFEDIGEASFADYLEQYDALPAKYIAGMYDNETKNLYDFKYGIRMDDTEKFFIGDSQVDIDGKDVIVKQKRYKGTDGLYELLFKKHPGNFTQVDIKNYREIVAKTNAHRRHYKSSKQIDGSKLQKYKDIIAPIVKGDGLYMEVTSGNVDYVHWNDPNELVDRLSLLLSSKSAGHTGHTNEINSIIEELRESNIIF